MKETSFNEAAYERAKKRVDEIRGFYHHLFVYLLFNVPLLIFTDQIAGFLQANVLDNQEFGEWFRINMYITPFFWGIGLFFHGISTFIFRGSLLKKWEERQLKKYLDED